MCLSALKLLVAWKERYLACRSCGTAISKSLLSLGTYYAPFYISEFEVDDVGCLLGRRHRLTALGSHCKTVRDGMLSSEAWAWCRRGH